MNLKKNAIYVHIPFCDHKCIYCDFYSIVSYDNIDEYLNSLLKEIKYYSGKFNNNRIYETIFFGGGTPSFMKPKYIEKIITELKSNFNIDEDAEITLETNPGTVDRQKLKDFMNAGINRLSIGIQSFDNNELKFLTRIHDKKTATKTVEDAAAIGFSNISIDLIFSLPNQTLKTWKNNLLIATSLPLQHISAYSLILEKGTILNKMVLDGKVKTATETHDAKLYEYTIDFLTGKNFKQYEVSNFAKENYECRHNLYYWQYKDYLSFGTSAHSFMNGIRWWNFSSLKKYISEIAKNNHAVRGKEKLGRKETLQEIIMLGLRSNGIDLSKITKLNESWLKQNETTLDLLKEKSYIKIENEIIKCTPKGYLVCDELIERLS